MGADLWSKERLVEGVRKAKWRVVWAEGCARATWSRHTGPGSELAKGQQRESEVAESDEVLDQGLGEARAAGSEQR